jgi:hypothetical protein
MTDGNSQQSTKTARMNDDEEVSSDKRSSMSPLENQTARGARDETDELDDQGTTQEEAVEILQMLRDDVFESSDEKLALALGRPPEEIKAWLSGKLEIDSDGLLKARNLAMKRGVE